MTDQTTADAVREELRHQWSEAVCNRPDFVGFESASADYATAVSAARDEAALREAALVGAVRRRISYLASEGRVVLEFRNDADAEAFEAAMRAVDPLPPRECVLSDQSVVRLNPVGEYERSAKGPYMGTTHARWPSLLNRDTDTGADFDALKSFAAERGAV